MSWLALDNDKDGNVVATSPASSNPSPTMMALMGMVGNLMKQREEEDRQELEASGFHTEAAGPGATKSDELDEDMNDFPTQLFAELDPEISDLAGESQASGSATVGPLDAAASEKKEEKLEKSKDFHKKKKAKNMKKK